MKLWNNPNLTPMLLEETNLPFNNKNYIYEIKYDGIRALIFVNNKKIHIQSRNAQNLTHLFPELQEIKSLVKNNTIFDGEIVSLNNGIPSFSKLKERISLKNKTKIKNQSINNPVTFICFDILYNNKNLIALPLIERKKILNQFKENDYFIKAKYINEHGIELYNLAKKKNLEGIVAKEKTSLYFPNKRNNTWLKIKNYKTGSFIIAGFIEKENNVIILLGENKLTYVGKALISKKKDIYNKIKKLKPIKTSPFINYNEPITYISPKLKCKVKYIERTKNNLLRNPIIN